MDCDESNEVHSDAHQQHNQSMSSVHGEDDRPSHHFVNSILHHGLPQPIRNQESVTTKPAMADEPHDCAAGRREPADQLMKDESEEVPVLKQSQFFSRQSNLDLK